MFIMFKSTFTHHDHFFMYRISIYVICLLDINSKVEINEMI